MANPQPCKVCETEGVNSVSDWIVSAQTETTGFPPGTSFWVWQSCLAGLMVSWLTQQFTEADQHAAEHPAEPVEIGPRGEASGPGVLEQIERDEGEQPVNGTGSRSRKSKAPPTEDGQVVEASQEAETADEHI